MEDNYPVTLDGKHTGKVLVRRQGLYYHFSCRCCLPEEGMYRLQVVCGAIRENLGLLVPQEGSFVLNTKLPVKRIGEGELSFSLIPKQEAGSVTFIPICPEEPFAYLSRLKESFLQCKDGQAGICIRQKQER